METTKEKKQLYKQVYNAARRCIDDRYQKEPEAVKAKRDCVCRFLFGRSYEELTNEELTDVINELDVQSGATSPNCVKILASKSQLSILRFYAITTGLFYFDFKDIEFYDRETDLTWKGIELKMMLKEKFEKNKGFLPKPIYRILHEQYINPKSHKFLIEGGYKKFVKNENNLHYEYLRPEEAQYLIKRWGAIYQNISQYVTAKDISAITEDN